MLILDHLLKQEKGNREKFWLNGKFTGIISTNHWIKTS